jgi:serine/threonine-protein kinase
MVLVQGQVIAGKYEIGERLGQGGMGAVFEAKHLGTGGRVAIKLIGQLELRDDIKARFAREARAAGAIESMYIVRVFDAGIDHGTGMPYLVMDRLRGEDLAKLLSRVGPLGQGVALRIAAQACLGLAKAHAAGVIHRDIKPANLFLADGDAGEVVVKILDFGVAKLKSEQMRASASDDAALTTTGTMLGSPHYMSPEQAESNKAIDHRSDIWSLGVVLYKALTGRTPHAGLDAIKVLVANCTVSAPPPRDVAPWIAPEVAAIVARALRIDPAARFQSAMEMHDAIRALDLPRAFTRTSLVPVPPEVRESAPERIPRSARIPGDLASARALGAGSASQAPTEATLTAAHLSRRLVHRVRRRPGLATFVAVAIVGVPLAFVGAQRLRGRALDAKVAGPSADTTATTTATATPTAAVPSALLSSSGGADDPSLRSGVRPTTATAAATATPTATRTPTPTATTTPTPTAAGDRRPRPASPASASASAPASASAAPSATAPKDTLEPVSDFETN